MRLTLLGTGTSTGVPVPTCRCAVCRSEDSRDRRLRPSALIEWPGASLLIDASTDLRQQALRHEIERIDAVLVTHAHADHVLGLDELRLYNWRQGGAVPLYGSRETLEALSKTFWYVFDGEPAESTKPAIERHEIAGAFELRGRTVEPLAVWHGRLPVLGFRIGSLAYVTDANRIPQETWPRLAGLDLLVLNALRERPHPTHFTLAEALEIAARAGARRTILTHMSHEIGHEAVSRRLPRGVELGYDGLRVEIEDRP